jgi:hypothetical protein
MTFVFGILSQSIRNLAKTQERRRPQKMPMDAVHRDLEREKASGAG